MILMPNHGRKLHAPADWWMHVAAGSIVNAPLGKIYLMTADHCFTDKNEISDFEFWMLLFNYYTACGNNTSPPVTEVIQVCAS